MSLLPIDATHEIHNMLKKQPKPITDKVYEEALRHAFRARKSKLANTEHFIAGVLLGLSLREDTKSIEE